MVAQAVHALCTRDLLKHAKVWLSRVGAEAVYDHILLLQLLTMCAGDKHHDKHEEWHSELEEELVWRDLT